MQTQRAAAPVERGRSAVGAARSRRSVRRSRASTSTLRRKLPSCSGSPHTASYTRRSSPSVNGSSRNAVASVVYSSLARARSTPSAMTRAWSNASGTPSALPIAVDREVVDRPEPRVGRVGSGDDARRRREPDVRDRHHAHPRIAIGRAVGAQLFEVAELDCVVAARDEHARSPRASSRRAASSRSSSGSTKPPGSAHWPRNGWPLRSTSSTASRPAAHGQQHDVDGHRDARIRATGRSRRGTSLRRRAVVADSRMSGTLH